MPTIKDIPTKGIFLITAYAEDDGYRYTEDGEREHKMIPTRRFLSVLYHGVSDAIKNTFQRWWITAHIHESESVSIKELTKDEALVYIESDDVSHDEKKYFRECIARFGMEEELLTLGEF